MKPKPYHVRAIFNVETEETNYRIAAGNRRGPLMPGEWSTFEEALAIANIMAKNKKDLDDAGYTANI